MNIRKISDCSREIYINIDDIAFINFNPVSSRLIIGFSGGHDLTIDCGHSLLKQLLSFLNYNEDSIEI